MEDQTLLDTGVASQSSASAAPSTQQQRLDDHTRELGIQGVRNVRSILQNARQSDGQDGHQSDDLVAEPKAA